MKPKPRDRRRPDVRAYLICAMLAASVLAVYWRAGSHPFTLFDDTIYVTGNPHVLSGLTVDSIRWAFTSSHGSNWHPLTGISLMTDVQVTKWLDPANPAAVFHWTNILLHAANTVILFLLLTSATGFLWRSAFVAALFAIHPLHVEPVAWIADRKDVLSTFFWLLATWAYIGWTRQPRARSCGAVLACFTLGLMAKPMVVTLPFTLLLLDFWPLRRKAAPVTLVVEKLPLFALAAGSCILTLWAQRAGGSVVPLGECPIGLRLPAALVAYPAYILKMILPIDLAVFYPHPGSHIPQWQVIASAVFILGASLSVLRFAGSRPYLPVGWFWFLITLVPVIGLVQVGMQFIADRYTYIPLIGLFIIIAWGVPDLARRFANNPARGLAVTGTCVLATMLALTWVQLGRWQDDGRLLGHTIAVTKNNYLILCLLGDVLQAKGDYPGAVERYKQSIGIHPRYGTAQYNLGNLLLNLRRTSEAVVHYREALRIYPERSQVYNNLACALNALGRTREAERRFRQAIARDSANYEAHYNLGSLLLRKGQPDEAIGHFEIAHRLAPNNATIQAGLQRALQIKR